jgi:putative phosphoribosyl transferase
MEITIDAGPVEMPGTLTIPPMPSGIVLFAHGSGSSRHSPRNRFVAQRLNDAAFATLLFDLLDPSEEADRRNVFDIELLAERLVRATRWTHDDERTRHLPLGYFGASTGAAAALVAASELGAQVGAVLSRGGRPDLAIPVLDRVTTPTLLIVGGADVPVIAMNEEAQRHLHCENELVVVPWATHLFEEPGALEQVADVAAAWFGKHLARFS